MKFLKIVATAFVISSVALVANYGIASSAKPKDIVAIAASNPDFSTLVAALKAADLVTVLEGDGPFTVFAPTNEAFAKLPAGTVDDLLKPENKATLVAILTYHVVPAEVNAAAAMKLTEATSVEGSDITITTKDGTVKVDNAQVVAADIDASNGVIHVIDTVIMPAS